MHSMRWHAHYHTSGTGHIYQGLFKAFPIEADHHFYTVCRYVERNALRANLVALVEHWQWSSLYRRIYGDTQPRSFLSPWPLPVPDDWVSYVQQPQTEAELAAVRYSVQRGTPFGAEPWQEQMAERLGLKHTLRRRGRPRKTPPSTEDASP
jgi:putative transposase